MSDGTAGPVAQPQGPPWVLLIVGLLLALGVYRGPEIIRALGERNSVVVPDDKPSSKTLFADRHCAEYFAGAAEHVAVLIETDGKAGKPRFTDVASVSETLAGAFCRSTVYGDLHDVDKDKLAKFVKTELDESGLSVNKTLDADARVKLVEAWRNMAKSALESVK